MPLPCAPLLPNEIPRLTRWMRLAAHGRYTLETRGRKLIGGKASPDLVLERALFRLSGENETAREHFQVSRQLAEAVLGHQLRVNVETLAVTHRMHDWVRCGVTISHTGDFFLSTANWRPLLSSLAHCPVLEEARQLHEASFRYQQTASFAHYIGCMREGHPLTRNKVRLDTDARVNAYFARFVALFESIANHGFLRLREARRLPENLDRPSSIRGLFTLWGEKDLGIALSAEHGVTLLPGGKHRLAVARVLGVDRIPVTIRMLHVSWLKTLGTVEPGQWREALRRAWVQKFNAAAATSPHSPESRAG